MLLLNFRTHRTLLSLISKVKGLTSFKEGCRKIQRRNLRQPFLQEDTYVKIKKKDEQSEEA